MRRLMALGIGLTVTTVMACSGNAANYEPTFSDYIVSLGPEYPPVSSYQLGEINESFNLVVGLFEMDSLATGQPITEDRFFTWVGNLEVNTFSDHLPEIEREVLGLVHGLYQDDSAHPDLRAYADPTSELKAEVVCEAARGLAMSGVSPFIDRDFYDRVDISCPSLYGTYLSTPGARDSGYVAWLSARLGLAGKGLVTE